MEVSSKHILYVIVFKLLISSAVCANVTAWEGEAVVLPCGPHKPGDKAITSWCKMNDEKICKPVLNIQSSLSDIYPPWTSADVQVVNESSLNITSVSYARDNGTFHCTSVGIHVSVELLVHVYVRDATLSGPELPVPENTEVTFTCEAEGGNPAPNITWEIPETSTQPEPTVSDVSSQISLTLTKDMNNQDLVCRAQQGDRQLTDIIRLNISYKPTAEITITPAEYYHGDHITLTCSTDGNPDPVITWRFDDNLITNVRPPGNTLHIGQLNQPYAGIYSCLAVNSQGSDTASANVTLTAKNRNKAHTFDPFALVVLPVIGLVMVVFIVFVCYRQSKTVNNHEKVALKKSNEVPSAAAMRTDGQDDTETEREPVVGAVGGTERQELQGHYASIWFDLEMAGTSRIRRGEEPTIYAQIDFKATARLLKNKGKGKKSKL